ncbi:unnamed protein product [Ectocarpus sp. 13 AM-2016]
MTRDTPQDFESCGAGTERSTRRECRKALRVVLPYHIWWDGRKYDLACKKLNARQDLSWMASVVQHGARKTRRGVYHSDPENRVGYESRGHPHSRGGRVVLEHVPGGGASRSNTLDVFFVTGAVCLISAITPVVGSAVDRVCVHMPTKGC